MSEKHARRPDSTGLTRRSFLGTAAGGAALALLRPGHLLAGPGDKGKMLDDFVGRLCYNENPLGPSPAAIAAMIDHVSLGHRYHDSWYANSLRDVLVSMHGLSSSSQTIAGSGATEMINLAALAFADPDGNVVCPNPSYSQFPGDCSFLGAQVIYSNLDANHRIDLDDMASKVDGNTSAVCITNPNNPTATVLHAADLASFIDSMPAHVTVVVDEAYHDYVQDPLYQTAIEQVKLDKNVVVLRTMSKVYGMAGVRCGYAVGKSSLISSMSGWHVYATVSRIAQEGAIAALGDTGHVADTIALNNEAKAYCFSAFDGAGLSYIPSETSFFMVDVGMSSSVVRSELAARGIRVRDGWGMPTHLRVSTGNMTDMESFITELLDILGLSGGSIDLTPKVTLLHGNYPNPASRSTSIPYSLASNDRALIQVFDIHGRLVKTIVNRSPGIGHHTVDWDGTNDRGAPVAAGSYFYRLSVGDVEQTRRLILVD